MNDEDKLVKEFAIFRDEIYNLAHAKARKSVDLYEGRIACLQPVGDNSQAFPSTIPPTSYQIIETGVIQTATGHFNYDIKPYKTQDEKTIGDKLKEACIRTTDLSNELSGNDVFEETARYLNICGQGVQKCIFHRDRYKIGLWPISYVSVDPLSFFADPAGRFVIEFSESYISVIKETIRKFNESVGKDVYDTTWFEEDWAEDDYHKALWVERWSPQGRMFYVMEGESNSLARLTKEEQKNHFKEVPHKWRYSGKGRGPKAGAEDRMVGALYGLESMLEAEARSFTALENHLRYHVYQEKIVDEMYAQFYQGATTPNNVRPVPKEAMPSQGGVELSPEPKVSQDLMPFFMHITNYLMDMGANPSLLGVADSDVSGRRFEGQVQQAATLFAPFRRSLSEIASDTFSMMARLCGNDMFNSERIYLGGGEHISPNKIDEHVQVKVGIEIKNPMYDQMMIENGLRLYERGVIPLQMFVEDYLKLPDAADHLAKILAEKTMMNEPTMQMQLTVEALKEQGMDEQAQMIEQAMQGGQQGQRQGQNAASHTQTIDGERANPRTGVVGREGMPNA